METQRIINLLNGSDNESSKFATKKWYIIDNESKVSFQVGAEISNLLFLYSDFIFF